MGLQGEGGIRYSPLCNHHTNALYNIVLPDADTQILSATDSTLFKSKIKVNRKKIHSLYFETRMHDNMGRERKVLWF